MNSTHGMVRAVLTLSVALVGMDSVLAAGPGAAPVPQAAAEVATAAEAAATDRTQEPAASKPAITRPRLSRLQPSPADQVIENRVRRLSRVLELDESQQARLRELLANERHEIGRVRAGNPSAEADRTGSMLALLDRTREQIRAMLSEEQKKKYPAAIPRNALAPANADPEFWLRLTQPAPQLGAQ